MVARPERTEAPLERVLRLPQFHSTPTASRATEQPTRGRARIEPPTARAWKALQAAPARQRGWAREEASQVAAASRALASVRFVGAAPGQRDDPPSGARAFAWPAADSRRRAAGRSNPPTASPDPARAPSPAALPELALSSRGTAVAQSSSPPQASQGRASAPSAVIQAAREQAPRSRRAARPSDDCGRPPTPSVRNMS
jgi:hypothetical protein